MPDAELLRGLNHACQRPGLLAAHLRCDFRVVWSEEHCLEILAPVGNGSEIVVWSTDCPEDIGVCGALGLARPGGEWCAEIVEHALRMVAREQLQPKPLRAIEPGQLSASILAALASVPSETQRDHDAWANKEELEEQQRNLAGEHFRRVRRSR